MVVHFGHFKIGSAIVVWVALRYRMGMMVHSVSVVVPESSGVVQSHKSGVK